MRSIGVSGLAVMLGVSVAFAQPNPAVNEATAPSYLYTMSAKSGQFANGRLSLKDVPAVVYFSDRPYRLSGTLNVDAFDRQWDRGPDSFRLDPPNATLSVLGADGADNIVVELSDPQVAAQEDGISFKVRVLRGELPESFGTSALFIDMHFGPSPSDP
jgi:hypothetical protein